MRNNRIKAHKGTWVWKPDKRCWECDQCGETTMESVMYKPRFRFCPWCGAEMRGGR